MGTSLWEQYAKEHKIGLDGIRKDKKYKQMEKIRKNANNEWEAVNEQPVANNNLNDDTLQQQNGYLNMQKPRKSNDINLKQKSQKQSNEQKEDQKQSAPSNKDISELPKSLQAQIQESSVFFTYNIANDTHCPRALIMDLEPNVIDDVQSSAFGTLFNPSFYVKGVFECIQLCANMRIN